MSPSSMLVPHQSVPTSKSSCSLCPSAPRQSCTAATLDHTTPQPPLPRSDPLQHSASTGQDEHKHCGIVDQPSPPSPKGRWLQVHPEDLSRPLLECSSQPAQHSHKEWDFQVHIQSPYQTPPSPPQSHPWQSASLPCRNAPHCSLDPAPPPCPSWPWHPPCPHSPSESWQVANEQAGGPGAAPGIAPGPCGPQPAWPSACSGCPGAAGHPPHPAPVPVPHQTAQRLHHDPPHPSSPPPSSLTAQSSAVPAHCTSHRLSGPQGGRSAGGGTLPPTPTSVHGCPPQAFPPTHHHHFGGEHTQPQSHPWHH
mmetsp:Transcript_28500/g.58338  ORF Transcript_28500/g.58338 Transcript_28500/m.58338 type:complete len:308 (-) Transcript_28500:787-1710(-)